MLADVPLEREIEQFNGVRRGGISIFSTAKLLQASFANMKNVYNNKYKLNIYVIYKNKLISHEWLVQHSYSMKIQW